MINKEHSEDSAYHGADDYRPERRWSRGKVLGVIILVLAGVGIATYFVHDRVAKSSLQDALAEADRLDPGWRIEELEASRKNLPDEQNGAVIALKVAGLEGGGSGLLPRGWPTETLAKALDGLEPPVQLTDEQIKLLRDEMQAKAVNAAVQEARKLAGLPQGRYIISYSSDGVSTLLPHVQRNRAVTMLLTYDSLLLAQDGKVDEALASCRAAVNAGRAIGDEPTLISQLVRGACVTTAVNHVERVLAQGQPTEEALAAMQQLLEMEAEHPSLLVGMRGERVLGHLLMGAIERGEMTPQNLGRMLGRGSGGRTGINMLDAFIDKWDPSLQLGPGDHAALIRYHNQLVEIAKLPTEEQHQRFAELEKTLPTESMAVRLLAPAALKVAENDRRRLAAVRCGIVMIACERYRLANGRWPASLAELTPAYLKTVPLDPFDGRSLRMAAWEEGILVYSVGRNGVDDGGKVIANKEQAPADQGFRLWNPPGRRKLPLPPGGP